jgi:hydroxymethylbilane synthase
MRSELGTLRVGTRASRLALWQTDDVIDRLQRAWPRLSVERVPISTLGDRETSRPLSRIGDKGLFTRELEDGLRNGTIDLAVHSLKDLPTEVPEGLALGAIVTREDPRDALVGLAGTTLDGLPKGSRIGTSSLRRRAQIAALRPDLHIVDLRGNVPTRVEKVRSGSLDAAVLALAGLRRLGLEGDVVEIFDEDRVLPAPGQGAVAVQIRSGNRSLEELLEPLDDATTRKETAAERAVLGFLEGGCQVPVGAHAWLKADRMELVALVASLDGTQIVRQSGGGEVASEQAAVALGERVARGLFEAGAGEILAAIRNGTSAVAARPTSER